MAPSSNRPLPMEKAWATAANIGEAGGAIRRVPIRAKGGERGDNDTGGGGKLPYLGKHVLVESDAHRSKGIKFPADCGDWLLEALTKK